MPYDLTFTGGYFQISKFLHEIDDLVHTGNGGVTVSGRLVTVNGFELSPPATTTNTLTGEPVASAGTLNATLSVTTYVAPAGQGLTGGATPTAPAPTSTAVSASAPPPPTTP
jgi:hypothetical protein